MNVYTLIQQHPLLHADLKNLGITSCTLRQVAADLSAQLGPDSNDSGHNLSYVFAALDRRTFVRLVNTRRLAEAGQIQPAKAQSIVLLIAPWIDAFALQAL